MQGSRPLLGRPFAKNRSVDLKRAVSCDNLGRVDSLGILDAAAPRRTRIGFESEEASVFR
jgi:hypothetical protein